MQVIHAFMIKATMKWVKTIYSRKIAGAGLEPASTAYEANILPLEEPALICSPKP